MFKGTIATIIAKTMLSRMKLTDESVWVIIAKKSQGLIMIDDLAQLNEKSVENLYRVL